MKNLYKIEDELYIISSSEKIKENTQSFKQGLNGDWFYNTIYNFIARTGDITPYDFKIILTTNKSLIKDGVQVIDDEFLEWFVKNPSCEEVVVEKKMLCDYCGEENCDNLRCRGYIDSVWYEIIIPKKIIQIYKINDLKEAFLKGYVAKNNKEDYPFAVQKFLNSKLNENKK